MQIIALNDRHLISATKALRGKGYTCPECLRSMRVRKGIHRIAHFYHVSRTENCRQSGKSIDHLHVQIYLTRLFHQKIFMEYRFANIGRIADIYLPKDQMVIEIQCSPISLEEVKQRNRDYASLGLRVLWLLHESQFNRKKISSAARYLRKKGAYYIHLQNLNNLHFYDQWESIDRNIRIFKSGAQKIDLRAYKQKQIWQKMILNPFLRHEISMYYPNDRFCRFCRNASFRKLIFKSYRFLLLRKVRRFLQKRQNAYNHLFDRLLRKFCSE